MFAKRKWGLKIFIPLCFLLAAGLIFSTIYQPVGKAQEYDLEADLPVVGSLDNLQNLLEKAGVRDRAIRYYGLDGTDMIMEEMKSDLMNAPAAAGAGAAEYSATNVQVDGVDEADIIKTDGTYIYQVQGQKLTIVKAFPAADMSVVNSFTFTDPAFRASDIYVDGNYLVVMGSSSYYRHPGPVPMLLPGQSSGAVLEIYPSYYYPLDIQTSKVIVYDTRDKTKLIKLREVELQGSIVSTRKIDSTVYMVANRHISWYPYYDGDQDIPLPAYKDSLSGSSFHQIQPDKIRYFPDALYPSYILTAALDLSNLKTPLAIDSYLGNGENIYASLENLYVAVSQYNYINQSRIINNTRNTSIYKFALKPGATAYAGKGTVPGTILNQFSMDEHNNHFRIATTSDGPTSDGGFISQNNVYVLNDQLAVVGRVENIAPGEQIYSTRFMGERLYMVTFRTVDPFFVIDLAVPEKPQVLGQLKIPGYSNYLHPYDENHIIGFGKDTVEMKGWNGQSQAYEQGMKIAVFDVTDVSNPREMAKELIGDRGTDSELLHNHKALLFDRGKNLLAFPVTLMETGNNNSSNSDISKLDYGRFTFQGAYVYNIDLSKGFQLQGRITHLTSDDYLKAGDYWYNSPRNISRILYIGNVIYTISPAKIIAHDLGDLTHVNTVNLP